MKFRVLGGSKEEVTYFKLREADNVIILEACSERGGCFEGGCILKLSSEGLERC